MTRSERFKNERLWLKTDHFAVTKSLRSILEKAELSEEDQIRLAYIQNKVLTVVAEGQWAFVPRSYWRDKCDWGYTRYLKSLQGWGQLEINPAYWASKDVGGSFSKSFRVPKAALANGVCNLNFKRKRFRLPTPDNRPTDAVSNYALKCLSDLTVVIRHRVRVSSPEQFQVSVPRTHCIRPMEPSERNASLRSQQSSPCSRQPFQCCW